PIIILPDRFYLCKGKTVRAITAKPTISILMNTSRKGPWKARGAAQGVGDPAGRSRGDRHCAINRNTLAGLLGAAGASAEGGGGCGGGGMHGGSVRGSALSRGGSGVSRGGGRPSMAPPPAPPPPLDPRRRPGEHGAERPHDSLVPGPGLVRAGLVRLRPLPR